MTPPQLQGIVSQIKASNKAQKITPRELFRAFNFSRRTPLNCRMVDMFLKENELVVEPHYNDVWIDTPVELKPKAKAIRKSTEDPIKRLSILEAATHTPVIISRDKSIDEAITIMMMNDYSQLPVTTNGLRNICGYVSWTSIGEARANGIASNCVKDYMATNIYNLSVKTPLMEAIQLVYEHEFIVVHNESNEICGLVTATDISSQFLVWTKPFVMLEEIENQIRCLMDGKLLMEHVKAISTEDGRKVETIDDLTFGEYIRLLQNPDNWQRLQLQGIDQATFLKYLEEIRMIRNDVMHFDPEGLLPEQTQKLEKMAGYLKKVASQLN